MAPYPPQPRGLRGTGCAELGQGRVLAAHPGCRAKGLRGREDLHLHACACGSPGKPSAQEVVVARTVGNWAATERQIIEAFFRFFPTHARFVGDHRFDGVVGDLSKNAIRARVAEIDRQLSPSGEAHGLNPDQSIDRRALVAQLQAARFELTELRLPFFEPMFYAGPSELYISFYLKRPYAPLGDRLAALRRHLLGYSGFLEAARDNLDAALPRPNLDIAIEAIDGQVAYLEGEVRTAARDDAETLKAIEVAARQTRDFADWLQARRATADEAYALGEAHFLRLLGLREFVELDVAAL